MREAVAGNRFSLSPFHHGSLFLRLTILPRRAFHSLVILRLKMFVEQTFTHVNLNANANDFVARRLVHLAAVAVYVVVKVKIMLELDLALAGNF